MQGYQILARAAQEAGIEVFFYIMGGPMIDTEKELLRLGVRGIDTRHEQAAAIMAQGYSRVTRRPSLAIGCSGPGATNIASGIVNAWFDGAPVVCIGGSSSQAMYGRATFQEMDQVAVFEPLVKHAAKVYDARSIPEILDTCMRIAATGRPGPTYMDISGEILMQEVEEEDVRWLRRKAPISLPPFRNAADPAAVHEVLDLLAAAERPIVIAGDGVHWSNGGDALRRFLDLYDLPVFLSPQAHGVAAQEQERRFRHARRKAFRKADLVISLGLRPDYAVAYFAEPGFAADMRLVQVDQEPLNIGWNHIPEVGIHADPAMVLDQMSDAGELRSDSLRRRHADWIAYLTGTEAEKAEKHRQTNAEHWNDEPVHPARLCAEVEKVLEPGSILTIDGREILHFSRHEITGAEGGLIMNSGAGGMMGVGLSLAIGAKLARPEAQVISLHGDGSLGMHVMEIDTARRHGIDLVIVCSNNGGWSSSVPEKVGRDLGFTRFDAIAQALDCHGETVTNPDDIGPAIRRALAAGGVALVNVIMDPAVSAGRGSAAFLKDGKVVSAYGYV